MPGPETIPPNPAGLRHAIDTGRTGDKVPVGDPAAAPLGTDEEAAGTPPSREAVAMALQQEVRPDLDAGRNARGREARHASDWLPGLAVGLVALLVIAGVIIYAG